VLKIAILCSLLFPTLYAQPFETLARLPDWISIEPNIPYDRYPQTVIDIMRPKSDMSKTRPGVLVIHGGGWVRQAKERNVAGFCLPYLERGLVVANVEYRLGGVATAPAAVNDVLKAARWFYTNASRYHVDPKRIVVTGESAGGHLALMVGMTPQSAHLGPVTEIAAVVDVFGVTDLVEQVFGPRAQWYAKEWIPEQAGRRELAERLSPLNYVLKGLPPMLIIHGDADEVVPYDHATRLSEALKKVGTEVELITVPGGKHGFTIPEWNAALKQTFAFLEAKRICDCSETQSKSF
jgi:acetyl esterase/lipase